MERTPVLAMCGSLRAESVNRYLLSAIEAAAPDLRFLGSDLVRDLPLFNPDLDDDSVLPSAVREFRLLAQESRAAVIVSPEYVHGPSGVTKNALDWLVGSLGIVGKPVLLASASPGQTGGLRGIAGLLPTMQLLGCVLVDPVTVSRAATRMLPSGEVTDDALAARIRIAVDELRLAMGLPSDATAEHAAIRPPIG